MKKLTCMFGLSMALALGGVALADSTTNDNGPPPEHHGHHRPPEAAFTACASLTEGATCTAERHGNSETGKCVKVPEQFKEDAGKLFCGLPHPPHPPQDSQAN
jgi:hypothetical protein